MKHLIRAKALELGFTDMGVTSAEADWGDDLTAWLADGRHGDMGWMAETTERRSSPRGLWPEVRSVIVLATSYGLAGDPLALMAHPERGNISVYARNKDYHDLVKKRLKALASWMVARFGGDLKVFVDTAPVMEKPLAAQSGVGWRGRHTNLVSRRLGSWFVLSEIYTTLDLPADPPEPDHCGRCRSCQDACPTGAIEGPGRLDPRRCISYLTIEHKGHIPASLRPLMGNRVYGCDDCLAACPWNKFATPTTDSDFLPRAELTAPRLADLASLDDAAFRQIFAGSPVKRVGRDRFIRNVLIAVGNSGLPALLPVAERLVADSSPLVRAMAAWAIIRLGDEAEIAAWRERVLHDELDKDVLAEWERHPE
jgi:epoxyqueuosine reductase